MASNRFIHITGPRTLVDLATHSLFLVVSKILPKDTPKVQRCPQCEFHLKCDDFEAIEETPCNCFKYYREVLALCSNLPVQLRQETLETAQRELDNIRSVQILLGNKNTNTYCKEISFFFYT